MHAIVLALILPAFIIALAAAALARRVSTRLGALDSAPRPGQIKAPPRRIPNTGGIGIFLGLAIPLAAAFLALSIAPDFITSIAPSTRDHLEGMIERLPVAIAVLAGLTILHILGLIDDRKPLGPILKLAVMLAVAAAVIIFTQTRLLTMLDSHVGGSWLSIALTILWFVVIINAINFIDNMDGLAAGVAAIAAACLLASALIAGQWFVAALLALTLGSALGFLCLNFPPARIFMGDGGSLVLGFLLAFLSVRATYIPEGLISPQPHAFLTPLVILAVPLYDFISVVFIRLRQRRNPFIGDLQHFSHRLVQRGLSPRAAVLVIYGCTVVTALGGVALPTLAPWQATLIGAQTLLVLLVLALLEGSASRSSPSP